MFVNLNKTRGVISMKKQTYDYLISKGLLPNLSGFELIGSAIEKCSEDRKHLHQICKLYSTLSKECDCTSTCIERRIRHSIERSGSKLTNSEVIAYGVYDNMFSVE